MTVPEPSALVFRALALRVSTVTIAYWMLAEHAILIIYSKSGL